MKRWDKGWSDNQEHTLSGRTDSAWLTDGRVFEPRLLQHVLRFVGRVYALQYVELRGYCA